MLILLDNQMVSLAIQPVDAAGNPAKVDGVPQWSLAMSDANDVIGLDVAEDGLSASAITTGKLGTAQIIVNADADLGEGVKTIQGLLDIEVQAGEAVSLAVSAGIPVDK